ncbi:MAG: hypothetical protein HYZ37_00430 [Candidatus Solibacter usitatus]|nr:hypothetical protein [Candidatus Solibacter usitatus]
MGFLTTLEFAFRVDLGIDQWIAPDPSKNSFSGRMGPNAALAFVFLGVALLGKQTAGDRIRWIMEGSILACGAIALVPLLGYLYSASSIAGIGAFTRMALLASVLFVLLSIGLLQVPPHGPVMAVAASGGPGGVMLRWLLPAYAAILILASWLRITAEAYGWFAHEIGVAGMTVVSLALFVIAACAVAMALNRAADRQQTAQRTLEENEFRYHSIVDATFDELLAPRMALTNLPAAARMARTSWWRQWPRCRLAAASSFE